jgi:hypothetical protein
MVGLYELGRSVASMLLAYLICRVRLIMLIVIRRHILGDIMGQLIKTQHHIVPLMGHLALPHIWILTLPRKRQLALSIYRHLTLPGAGPWPPAGADICPDRIAGKGILPRCDSGNLSS